MARATFERCAATRDMDGLREVYLDKTYTPMVYSLKDPVCFSFYRTRCYQVAASVVLALRHPVVGERPKWSLENAWGEQDATHSPWESWRPAPALTPPSRGALLPELGAANPLKRPERLSLFDLHHVYTDALATDAEAKTVVRAYFVRHLDSICADVMFTSTLPQMRAAFLADLDVSSSAPTVPPLSPSPSRSESGGLDADARPGDVSRRKLALAKCGDDSSDLTDSGALSDTSSSGRPSSPGRPTGLPSSPGSTAAIGVPGSATTIGIPDGDETKNTAETTPQACSGRHYRDGAARTVVLQPCASPVVAA